MNAKSFSITVQGASHIKKNKVCQDSSEHYYDDNYAIAIVCDGHGGDDYVRSDVGSRMASEIAVENIKEFVENINGEAFFENPDSLLRNLEASIISRWNESVNEYSNLNPFTEDELHIISEKAKRKYTEKHRVESAYGTTVIAVAVTPEYWFGIHIGDGKCVAINDEGKFVQPIPWDPKCFLNATTSICDSDALDSFRHFYSAKLPAAVFVGSDGVDDCFSNNEQLHNLYKTILYSFASSEFDSAVSDLSEYLPRLSAKGSGDDVSVAAVLDMDIIPELSIVKDFDREKEKARVEENARKEALKNEEEKRRVEEEHAKFQKENNISKEKRKGKTPKFCIHCGFPLNPQSKFCSECGHPINYLDVTKNKNDYQVAQTIKLPGEGMDLSSNEVPETSEIKNDTLEIDETSVVNEEFKEIDASKEVEDEGITDIYPEKIDDMNDDSGINPETNEKNVEQEDDLDAVDLAETINDPETSSVQDEEITIPDEEGIVESDNNDNESINDSE